MILYGSRWALSDKPEQEATPLQSGDFLEVLTRQHSFDAHAWPYVVHPAVRVSVSSPLVEEVMCWTIWLDFDASRDHPAILQAFQKIPEDHYLNRFAAIYPTLSGMRFVYRLEQPLTAHEYGPVVRGMAVDLYRFTGLQVDPSTDQWHRCFRLPSVTRSDGKSDGPTWQQPYWFETIFGEQALDPDILPSWVERLPWDPVKSSKAATVSTGEMPEITSVPTHRMNAYRKALRTSRFSCYLFDFDVIPEGRRDPTLMAMAAEIVARCFRGVPDSSLEEIFAVCVPVTDTMQRDGSESWGQKLWRMLQHCWNAEAKKEQERIEKERNDLTVRDLIIKRMLQWIPQEQIPTGDAERRDFIERHFCLQTASGAFVIQKNGEYTKTPLRPQQLSAHFNDGLHCLVENGFRTKSGAVLDGKTILNNFSTVLDDVEYLTGAEPCVRLHVESDRRILRIIPFALRQDLLDAAEFDRDVGEWLETFNDASLLKRWLAAALALAKGPVSACYLNGPARVGKSLLAMGIAEAFHCQPVPAAQAFSDFNGALLSSPVIMVDEGLPTRITGLDTADMFRSLITGSSISTQRKYQDQINTKFHYRIVFAANSFDMVGKLIGKRTMDPQDREAFRERILVIETGQKPADFLDRNGAMAFTKNSKKGSWLGGECRLARHLLKLYKMYFEEQEFIPDGRLLVEGRKHAAFTLAFDLSGAGRDVVDDLTSDITKLVGKKTHNDIMLPKCVTIEGGQVWLKKRPYIRYKCDRAPARAETYSTALHRFCLPETKTSPTDMTQMVRVDVEKLIYCAQIEGLDYTALHQLHLTAAGVS